MAQALVLSAHDAQDQQRPAQQHGVHIRRHQWLRKIPFYAREAGQGLEIVMVVYSYDRIWL